MGHLRYTEEGGGGVVWCGVAEVDIIASLRQLNKGEIYVICYQRNVKNINKYKYDFIYKVKLPMKYTNKLFNCCILLREIYGSIRSQFSSELRNSYLLYDIFSYFNV